MKDPDYAVITLGDDSVISMDDKRQIEKLVLKYQSDNPNNFDLVQQIIKLLEESE